MSGAETFAQQAPLLADSLAEIVRDDILHPSVTDAVEAIYVYGSFVNPDTQLDRGGDVSDIDVYAIAPRILPAGVEEISTRFTATQHGLLSRLAAQGVLDVYGNDSRFTVGFPPVSDEIIESLERAERATFHAQHLDTELLLFRPLDLTLGTEDAFAEFLGDDPRLQIWP